MKRAVKAIIAVYFAVFMCFFGGMTAFAWNVDTMHQSIKLKNVPEGTAFADILVRTVRTTNILWTSTRRTESFLV